MFLGVPWERSARSGVEKNIFSVPEIEILTVLPISRHYTD
jgi:hypothetical protein